MQYCVGGDLFHFIKGQPGQCLTEDQVLFYAAEVLLALEYLHSKGFIHRDLKPENILINSDGHLLLTDFDLSKHSTKPVQAKAITKKFSKEIGVTTEPEFNTHSYVGTEEYFAPEVIYGLNYNGSVDWWTYGILIYEMLYGHTPYKNKPNKMCFTDFDVTFSSINPQNYPISKTVIHLLKSLLIIDPQKRLGTESGATDIKDHPFFKDVNWQLLHWLTPPVKPTILHPLDTKYFKNYNDDWSQDDVEIDPNDQWSNFKNVLYTEDD
jgi:protein-serine/threonine kinase